MASPTPDLAAVTTRLAQLERDVRVEKRRTRWLLGVVGLAAVGVVVAWTWATTTATAQVQGTSVGPKVLQANQFLVDDENGKTRAVLAATPEGPGLTIFDPTGKTRVILGVLKDGPILSLRDERGETRALMAVTTGGRVCRCSTATVRNSGPNPERDCPGPVGEHPGRLLAPRRALPGKDSGSGDTLSPGSPRRT